MPVQTTEPGPLSKVKNGYSHHSTDPHGLLGLANITAAHELACSEITQPGQHLTDIGKTLAFS